MLGCLTISRWGLSLFTSMLLIIFLPIVATLLNIGSIITNKEYVKNFVNASGIYQNGVSFVVDNALNATKDKSNENNPDNQNRTNDNQSLDKFITETELKTSINKIINKNFLETNGNIILDSVYDYLEGKTATPTFTIDLKELKQTANTTITELISKKVTAFPQCKTTKTVKNFDISNTDCLPKGISLTEINKQIGTETSKVNFIQTDTFSSSDLKLDEKMLKNIQSIYSLLQVIPILFIVILILLIAFIIFVTPKRKTGIIVFSISLILSGVLLMILTLFGNIFIKSVVNEQLRNNKDLTEELHTLIENNTSTLLQSIYEKNFMISYISIGFGIACIIGVIVYVILKKRKIPQPSLSKQMPIKKNSNKV